MVCLFHYLDNHTIQIERNAETFDSNLHFILTTQAVFAIERTDTSAVKHHRCRMVHSIIRQL